MSEDLNSLMDMIILERITNHVKSMAETAPEGVVPGVFKDGNTEFYYLNTSLMFYIVDFFIDFIESSYGDDSEETAVAKAIQIILTDTFKAVMITTHPGVYFDAVNSAREG